MPTSKDRTATPKKPATKKSTPKKRRFASATPLSLSERLACDESRFTIKEVQQIARCGRTKVTVDRRAGLLATIQQGRSVRATGEAVRAYLAALETPDLPPDPRAAHLPHRRGA